MSRWTLVIHQCFSGRSCDCICQPSRQGKTFEGCSGRLGTNVYCNVAACSSKINHSSRLAPPRRALQYPACSHLARGLSRRVHTKRSASSVADKRLKARLGGARRSETATLVCPESRSSPRITWQSGPTEDRPLILEQRPATVRGGRSNAGRRKSVPRRRHDSPPGGISTQRECHPASVDLTNGT